MLFSHVGDVVFAVLVPAMARHTLPSGGRLQPLLFHTLFLSILPAFFIGALRGGLEMWGGGSWTRRKLRCRCRSFVALQEKKLRSHCKSLELCNISTVVGNCRKNFPNS